MADPDRAAALLRGAWIGVDGDQGARQTAESLAASLGARVLPIPVAEDRAAYHAAAVLAANFPVVLAALAADLLERAGVDATAARAAVRHLMEATVGNLPDGAHALTGPVARGDADTIARHVSALAGDRDALGVYLALTRAAIPIAARQGADPHRLQRIAAALDAAAGLSSSR